MDFYARQAGARRRTGWLLFAFVVAVTAVVLALDAVILALVGYEPQRATAFALVILSVILLGSLYRTMQLREGGGVVARSLGGVRVDRDSTDPARRRLLNIVEEMAIASGVPMPEVYVLEQETTINAFAAGHTAANAAIAVTQGAVERLTRDELQGVVAHEFSHLLNGDMRLNLQLLGWVFGLFALALIGRTVLRHVSRLRRGSSAIGLIGLVAVAALVLGWLGQLAGRILQAAVSRQRERLADASAVQFTRHPEGLKGALLKTAGPGGGSLLASEAADEVAHMLFAPGTRRLFATHPPLVERLHALDPRFDAGSLPAAIAAALRATEESTRPDADRASAAHAPTPGLAIIAAAPLAIARQAGQPRTLHVAQAQELRLAMPESLRELAGTGSGARALVLAVLLSHRDAVRERQLERLAKALGPAECIAVEAALPMASGLGPFLRLPALQQLFPALRRLARAERERLLALAEDLTRADACIDVFEYCLTRLLVTALRDELEARTPHGNATLASAAADLQVLFTTVARSGATDERRAREAYEAGMQGLLPRNRPEYAPREDWPLALDAALARLGRLHPFAKEALIEALVRTLADDDQLSVPEAELLRTVCAILHCPLPPLVPLNEGPLPGMAVTRSAASMAV